MRKSIVIFDLDGTIANLDHRLHHIKKELQDWESFFRECEKDDLNIWARSIIRAMHVGHFIHIVSGRPARTREKTMAWLEKFDIPLDALHLVRADGDHAPDDLLKQKWLDDFPERDKILFVVDDRQRVVDMWRRNGLVCLQCDAWPELPKPYPEEK